jgi:hypothetical protein
VSIHSCVSAFVCCLAGAFENEVEAARAYDMAALNFWGSSAKLNVSQAWPPLFILFLQHLRWLA